MLEIASWINAEEAGTFFGENAISIFGLVLVGLLASSIGLGCLLHQLESRVWHFAPADGQHVQESAILSTFRDRCLNRFAQVADRISSDDHLGLYFAISLFALSVTGAGFLALALEIGQQDWLVRFDHSLSASLHQHSTANAVWLFQLVAF